MTFRDSVLPRSDLLINTRSLLIVLTGLSKFFEAKEFVMSSGDIVALHCLNAKGRSLIYIRKRKGPRQEL